MRLHKSNKETLIKVSIQKQQTQSESITIADADLQEVFLFVKKNITDIALSVPSGFRTSIIIREYQDGKFTQNKSISIYGSDPIDVKEFLEENIRELNRLPLPSFLQYFGNSHIHTNVDKNQDVTKEWNKFVNKYI